MEIIVFMGLVGCVLSAPEKRIVGGSEAYPGEYPWQASLEYRSSSGTFTHVCGGTLIKVNQVVTSAQCVNGRRPDEFRVVLGQHRRLHDDESEQFFDITYFNIHPGYDGNNNLDGFAHDLAVLHLSGNADIIHSKVALLPLAEKGEDFTGQQCYISGWGKLVGTDSSIPDTLHGVRMTQIDNTDCATYVTDVIGAAIGPGHICLKDDNKSACNGDTGGPMMCNGKLAGIYSWVISPCRTTYPSVFVRISEYAEWINSQ